MKIGVMQPYLFPYLGYYQMVYASDVFVFYDVVNYIQRGYINRNYLLGHDAKQVFTVPVKKSSLGTSIQEIEISDYSKWRNKFLKQLQFTYGKAPYYNETLELLSQLLSMEQRFISQFCALSIKGILSYLGIERQYIFSSDIRINTEGDKEEKLEEIIEKMNGDTIVMPPGSLDLYSHWKPVNIKKETLKIPSVKYKQFGSQFIDHLSIIDILMFNSKEEVQSFIQSVSYQ